MAEKGSGKAKVSEAWRGGLAIRFHRPAGSGVKMEGRRGGFGTTEEDDLWQQLTLPVGNGFLGACIYGDVSRERLTFNEKTLWNGGPSPSRPDYNGGNLKTAANGMKMSEVFRRVQQCYLEGDDDEANRLADLLVGSPEGYGAYQSWGDIYLDYGFEDEHCKKYSRCLDLTTAVVTVEFVKEGIKYRREYFASYPDRVLVIRLTAEGGKMDLSVSFPVNNGEAVTERGLGKEAETVVRNERLTTAGKLQDNQLLFNGQILAVCSGTGKVLTGADNKSLRVEGAAEVVLYVAAATNYKNEYPAYRTKDTAQTLDDRVREATLRAAARGYDAVKAAHTADYRRIFDRVELDLGQGQVEPALGEMNRGEPGGGAPDQGVSALGEKGREEKFQGEPGQGEMARGEPGGGAPDQGVSALGEKSREEKFQGESGQGEPSRGKFGSGNPEPEKTADELLEAYRNGTAPEAEKRALETLLFQYGRYLTIASSREGGLPSNLQGLWLNRVGDADRIPWGCDYHMNVNLQMNYWPVYSANMAECAGPLLEYVNSLREPGRVTAGTYFGVDEGFTAHTQNTPFGWTCPGWNFSWGWSPAALPWILQNCYEYYEYTLDKEALRTSIYPILKECALLYDRILMEKDGRLVSAPAYSPEHGPVTAGNTYEQSLIWQLYEDVIHSAVVLGVDDEKVSEWREKQSRLKPIEIGESGQIKEWYAENALGSMGEKRHRHMSHLLGLFPGDLISADNREYLAAAVVSLKERGYSSTGWGVGQRINAWARTGLGDGAFRSIESLIKDGINPNLWDSHPPFQIDGNFGYTSGVAEMLLQSNLNYIHILPALPEAWSRGHFKGLRARGGFEVSADWTEGGPDRLEILSLTGGEAAVRSENIAGAGITDSRGHQVDFRVLCDDMISFPTEAGELYRITPICSKS